MSSDEEHIVIVDENDVVLRIIPRQEYQNTDIARLSSVFITNSKGEILLQLRSAKSKRYPHHWDATGGGHVSAGEDYDTAAKRELAEEAGIHTPLTVLGKTLDKFPDERKRMTATYSGVWDGSVTIDPHEVEEIRAFSLAAIRELLEQGKVHPGCALGLKKYFLNKK